jgi:DNA mismatch endonuclease (patch repair protein)
MKLHWDLRWPMANRELKGHTLKTRRRAVSRASGPPSYSAFRPVSELTSRIKRNNKSKGTAQERLLACALRQVGLRFTRNVKHLAGKPDFVFTRPRTVVFCDGDFWHGRNWKTLKMKLSGGANSEYWVSKIESNRKRDRKIRIALERDGWRVMRVWESQIRADASAVAQRIKDAIAPTQEVKMPSYFFARSLRDCARITSHFCKSGAAQPESKKHREIARFRNRTIPASQSPKSETSSRTASSDSAESNRIFRISGFEMHRIRPISKCPHPKM